MVATPEIRTLKLSGFALVNYPTLQVNAEKLSGVVVAKSSPDVQVQLLTQLVVCRGRTDQASLRAWTFSQNGHDFYVLKLGDQCTLIYDLTTEQWSTWNTEDLAFWRAQIGTNWRSSSYAGDDNHGIIWELVMDQGVDEDPVTAETQPFTRRVTGGLPQKLRNTSPVGSVFLTCAVGSPEYTGATITLRTSDDLGESWSDFDTLTANVSDFSQEFQWRSLGLIKAPGKLFEIVDNGATVRIDSLDMQ